MLFDLIRNGADAGRIIINLLVGVFVVFCTLPIHEYAHAFVATKLGDDTARLSGRLTINPLAHIDPFGAIAIILFGIGWAKPVPVNMRNFKNPRKDMAVTALAGPIANLVMAFVFYLVMNIFVVVSKFQPANVFVQVVYLFFQYAAELNIMLAVFNLIPIPPLDGSRLLGILLPSSAYYKIMRYEQIIEIAVFALIIFGAFNVPLAYLTNVVGAGINWLASLPFKAFIS